MTKRSLAVIAVCCFLAVGDFAKAQESAHDSDEVAPVTTPTPVSTPAENIATVAPSRWTGNSAGIFLGYSPIYSPQLSKSDRFNTGNIAVLEGGVEMKEHIKIALRYSKGTIPSLAVYDPTTFITTFTPNASLKIFSFVAGVDIPLNEPYEKLGIFQIFIPITFGSTMVSVSGDPYSFMAVSFDSSVGVGAHIYTKSVLRLDLSAEYHFGLPLTSFTGGSASSPDSNIIDPAGETMKAGLTGFEARIGVTFIFPDALASGENK